MLNKSEFLTQVLAKAKSKAAISRTLGITAPRVTELFNGTRNLSYDEAAKLAADYGVEPSGQITAELLTPILMVCLRYAPKEWSDRDAQHLAECVADGLELLRRFLPTNPSQDAIDLVAHTIAERFRHKNG